MISSMENMNNKTFFAIKLKDINSNRPLDYNQWEVILIEALNYHEAKVELKNHMLHEDYILIPKKALKHRDIVKQTKLPDRRI